MILAPGFCLIHIALAEPNADLNGLKNTLSSGCTLCVVCGGVLIIWMWLARANSITANSLWLPCPSRIRRTGFSFEGCTCCLKCWSHIKNISPFIQPLLCGIAMLSGGAPIIKRPFLSILFLGKIKRGGIKWPHTLIANINVIFRPLSPEVNLPTCFFPLVEITFSFLCTVETPVSSALCIPEPGNLYLSCSWWSWS